MPSPDRLLGLPGVKGHLIDLHLRRQTVHEVVTRIERDTGRTAKPFDCRIDILAVASPRIIDQEEHHAVVSAEVVGNEADYREWLHAALRPIA